MLRAWPLLLISLLLGVLALACDGDTGQPSTPTPSPIIAPTPMTFPERPEVTVSADKKYFANVETSKGTFRIELRPDIAIQTVNSFIFLAGQGYYDGVTFHRVIRDIPGKPDFMAQGGDPTGTGSGGPGYTLPAEFSDVPFKRGTVGLARSDDPDSGGSQFFITYNDQYQPALNGRYTVFGKVVEGMEVVDSLTPRDPENIATPQPPGDTITTIVIEEE
jgi:peptidylprolyl isomerase